MLYEEIGVASIVIGYWLDIEYDHIITPDEALDFEECFGDICRNYGISKLKMFVPGDSNIEPDEELFGGLFFGKKLYSLEVRESPIEIDLELIKLYLEDFETIDPDFWKDFEKEINYKLKKEIVIELISYGPFSSGAIIKGELRELGESFKYKPFISMDKTEFPIYPAIDGIITNFVKFEESSKIDIDKLKNLGMTAGILVILIAR